MNRMRFVVVLALVLCVIAWPAGADTGAEVSVPTHLQDGEEFTISLRDLIDHGNLLFGAVWTNQEGGGRPMTDGTGNPIVDPTSPLVFPRDFNRISAMDANSCAGCHNAPRAGGGGDIVANVFVLGQRFDFATFDDTDPIPTRGGVDENGDPVLLQTIANSRNTLGMFGSGFIEMLAREMTADLQAIRDTIGPGGSAALETKGVSFGTLSRDGAGTWDTSLVEGLVAGSLTGSPPSLVIRPFHQASNVISVRQFSNNAFNHHHGIQTTERFGIGADPDGDGFVDEMTRADVTAASVFQAQLAVPGRVIPRDPEIEAAVLLGEQRFLDIGCTTCHVPSLLLNDRFFVEPNPFNPPGNLQPGQAPDLVFDLTDKHDLELPRLRANHQGVVRVPAFTDLKVHDITSGPGDPNIEALDMNQPPGSAGFFAGNSRFITRKLWGIGNEPPFFHHGQFTTMRQSIEAHHGEAEDSFQGWLALSDDERDAIIEFLRTLQVLPEGTRFLVVDENFEPRPWDSVFD